MNRTKLGEGRHEMNKLCVNSGDSLGSLAITQIFTRKLHATSSEMGIIDAAAKAEGTRKFTYFNHILYSIFNTIS